MRINKLDVDLPLCKLLRNAHRLERNRLRNSQIRTLQAKIKINTDRGLFDDNQDQAEAVKDIYLTLRKHASSLHKTGEAGDMKKWAALVNTALQALEQTRSALSTAEDHIQEQQVRLDALVELATKDELTGLFNRRGFLDAFYRELDKTNRGLNKGGLLIMIDLDGFKEVNDTYGHAAGDEALKLVGRHLQRTTRIMDVAARLGGDEFVLLFSHADKQCAFERAQNLALKLNSLVLHYQGHTIPVKASIGIKSFTMGDDVAAVMQSADRTMYRAKTSRKDSQESELA